MSIRLKKITHTHTHTHTHTVTYLRCEQTLLQTCVKKPFVQRENLYERKEKKREKKRVEVKENEKRRKED